MLSINTHGSKNVILSKMNFTADLDAHMQSSALLVETMDLILYQRKKRTKVKGDLVKDKLVYSVWPSTMANQVTLVSPEALSTRAARRSTTRRMPCGDTASFTTRAESLNSPCLWTRPPQSPSQDCAGRGCRSSPGARISFSTQSKNSSKGRCQARGCNGVLEDSFSILWLLLSNQCFWASTWLEWGMGGVLIGRFPAPSFHFGSELLIS